MNRKIPLIAFVALSGALAAGLAQARDADLRWSVTIGAPIYAPNVAPIHAPPPPVYGRPARGPSPGYVAYQQPTRWDMDGDGIPNRYDRLYNPRWDVDGDGIPNRHDRTFNPRHDRDGDGIPNRYDRLYNPRWDVDGDGVPNRHDRTFNPRHDRDGDGVPNRYDAWPDQPGRGRGR